MNQNKSLAITSNPQTNICVAGGHVELVGVNVIEVNKILNRDRKDIKLNAPKAESIKSLNSVSISQGLRSIKIEKFIDIEKTRN